MFPKEHGTYGQLGCPVVTALAIGHGRPAGFLVAAGAIAAFLAYEPLQIVLGRRGARAKREFADVARRHVWARALLALCLGGSGITLGRGDALRAAIVPVVLAAAFVSMVSARREKSAVGETLAALVLSSAAVPISVCAGAELRSGAWVAASWAAASIIGTLSVRGVIQRSRDGGNARTAWIAAIVAVTVSVAAVALWQRGVASWAVAASMMGPAAVALGLAIVAPSPKHLRTVGWTLLLVTIVGVGVLVAGLRSW